MSERVVLIGLDGATWSVLDPLMRDGTMPFLGEFVDGGARATLTSTAHPLTPAAWTTVVTGRSPGSHGVYDFVRVERGGEHLSYTLSTSADVVGDTIWTIASRHGRRVTTLNFPGMFPAPAVDGFVVPGFVPWNYLPRAVRPRGLYDRLRAHPDFNARELAIDWTLERKALQGLAENEIEPWVEFHTAREQQWFEVARFLMREEPCELTAVLFDGIDKLQHVCYHLLDPAHAELVDSPTAERLRARCLDYFRRLDGFLAEIVALAGDEAHVLMASDHGFQLAGGEIFYANVWLQQHGYLAWADGVEADEDRRLTLEGHTETSGLFDWSRTVACALTASSNGIFIRDDAPPDVRERLARELLEAPMVDAVLPAAQTFPGPCSERAPDLTLRLADRSFLSVLRADAPLKRRRSPYGTHHPDGVLMAGGPGVRCGEDVGVVPIVAVAPSVLHGLGVPIPADLEADPLMEVFEPAYAGAHPGRRAAPAAWEPPPDDGAGEQLDDEAEAQIFERLKALGYVE